MLTLQDGAFLNKPVRHGDLLRFASMKALQLLALGLISLLTCSSCSTTMKQPPLRTVSHVDLPRYMGDWYIIANIPYSLENGKVATKDRYTLRPDGKIDNAFVFHRKTFDAPEKQWNALAWVHDKNTNAEWRVQFFWPLSIPYLIIDLDKDYQWSVVGYPSRNLGWVLSRKPVMDEAVYQGILKRLAAQGYDPKKFVKVPQKALP